jgi:signal transduction histidine kinase
MASTLRLQRLDALLALLKGCASEGAASCLEQSLDAVMLGTAARAVAAYRVAAPELPAAQRRLSPASGEASTALLRALRALSARASATRCACALIDVRRDGEGIEDAPELLQLGARAAYAVPIFSGSFLEGTLVLLLADDSALDEETHAFVDSVAGFVGVALDRDRAHQAAARLRDELTEAGRLATLGLYTASVAHELRGPVGALLLQHSELNGIASQLAAHSAGPAVEACASELSEVALDMAAALDRVRNTVGQLTLTGHRDKVPAPVRMADVVRESLAIARPHLDRRGVLLREEIDRSCFTLGRRDNLGQVLLNLLFNAADAAETADHPAVWVTVTATPSQVLLSVEDNGPGVPPEAMSEIFEPFFTTKERGKGTGLGLKICTDVITAHGGQIEVHVREGGGACFRVALPRCAAVLSLPPSCAPGMLSLPSERQRILVVDDDPIFSRTVRRALRPHEVRLAAPAAEAETALLDPS